MGNQRPRLSPRVPEGAGVEIAGQILAGSLRQGITVLFALTSFWTLAGDAACASMNKCKHPDGRVEFTDQPCPSDTLSSTLENKLPIHLMPTHDGACRYFDGFKEGRNGTVTDPRDGLVWQLCAAGQSWTGSECKGEGVGMSWWDAMQSAKDNRFLSKSDWRVPSAEELKAIVGKHEDCLISDETKKPWRAVSRVFPAVRRDGFVGAFWSSTTFTSSGAWVVYFFDGAAFSVGRNAVIGNVRLVRGGNAGTPYPP